MKSKQRSASREAQASEPTASSTPPQWPSWLRGLVSLLVTLHLLAVFSAPWSQPPPSSDLANLVAGFFSPYLKFMSLDNGYRFFAPDPGPSHLIKYEFLDADGGVISAGRFPDRKIHWPRLLYHRHFMIAEMTFQQMAAVPEIPPDVNVEELFTKRERDVMAEQLRRAKLLQRSIADYLLSTLPEAKAVRLISQTHEIPTPLDLQRGLKLTDERLYQERLLGEFRRTP